MQLYHHQRIETYDNDQKQAQWTLWGLAAMAILCVALILAAVLR